ncbi:nucleotide exchange factor GrpE [Saccharopolyspora sp. MS10]|uniref:nucleotide exchange factor GrpE n=1 Tax=Saccharopolyspora sp. MS10 TaxID=3385973 RepID=UPI0039A03FCA
MGDDRDVPRRSPLPVPATRRPTGPRPVPPLGPSDRPDPVPERESAEQLRDERDAHLESLRRVTAEFDNYRKRMLREQTAYLDRAAEGVLAELLPVLDAVELGARHNPEALGAVHRQLQRTLAAEGLHRLEPLGEPFDPAEHEAAAPEPSSVVPLRRRAAEPDAVVAEVLRPGYRIHGHLLRPALVRLSPG